MNPRLLVFDWHGDGHHEIYMERTVDALAPCSDVVAAGPNTTLEKLAGQRVDLFDLGNARPEPADRHEAAELAAEEISLLKRAVRESGADRVLHLYTDPILAHLTKSESLGIPVATTVFFPRWHYPWAYGNLLPPRDAAKAYLLELAVKKWRSHNDAMAIFSHDELAVRRWNRRSGAPAHWFPEPPVSDIHQIDSDRREGCVLYGVLAPRKGIDRLAAAVAVKPSELDVVLAGPAAHDYAREVEGFVEVMRSAGSRVAFRGWMHREHDALELLRQARCVVLPYHRHCGPSRVLVEAASVRTPVLVHDHGLVASLVRRHGIGVAVDCGEPRTFRRALDALCADGEATRYGPSLQRFAARYSAGRFESALRVPLGLGTAPTIAPPRGGSMSLSVVRGSLSRGPAPRPLR